MGDSLLAVDFGTRSPAVVAMSAGSDHTCVIFFGGSMKVRTYSLEDSSTMTGSNGCDKYLVQQQQFQVCMIH